VQAPAPKPERPTFKARLFSGATRALAYFGQHVLPRRFKELTLLALPYQVAAVLTALVAVGYAKLFNWMEHAQQGLLARDPRYIFLTAPMAFLLAWWLVRRYAPMAAGSGIPQLMAAIEIADEKADDRSWRFLNLRVILVKVASSVALVSGGGAVGREGPTLQIAGSVYRIVHRVLPSYWPRVSRKIMMITGGAAGLSAAFNTPLGGIVFVMEELTRTHLAKFRTALLASVILSGMTAQLLMGPYLFLGYPQLESVGFSFMYKVLVIALAGGAAGALFCKALLVLDAVRRKFTSNVAQAGFAIVCAVLVGCCYMWLGPHAIGSGKMLLESYLFSEALVPQGKDIAARLLGPLFSFSTGAAGGIFAPALSAGAAIGGYIGSWFEPSRGELNLLIMAGMAAFLAGVSRSPFTSAILVLEMTDRHSAIFQLMYAAMIASLVAHAVDARPFYERMKQRLLATLPKAAVRKAAEEPPSPFPGLG
jgi:H+/Cl- antiporter ClcA